MTDIERAVQAAAEAIMRVADQQVSAPRVRYRRGGQDHKHGGCFYDQARAAITAAIPFLALSPPEPTEGQVADEAMLVAIRAAFDSDNVAAKNIQLRLAFDYIRKQQAALRAMPLQDGSK